MCASGKMLFCGIVSYHYRAHKKKIDVVDRKQGFLFALKRFLEYGFFKKIFIPTAGLD